MSIRLAVVGLGKIARDQHLPAIAANRCFELVAVASRNAALDGAANLATLEELLVELASDAFCSTVWVERTTLLSGSKVSLVSLV